MLVLDVVRTPCLLDMTCTYCFVCIFQVLGIQPLDNRAGGTVWQEYHFDRIVSRRVGDKDFAWNRVCIGGGRAQKSVYSLNNAFCFSGIYNITSWQH